MLLHAANHFRHQVYAVADGLSLENSVIYTGAVICLVRNSAQDQEWDTVKIAHLSNGRSLHLCTHTGKCFTDPLLFILIRNKLIPLNNTACKSADLRIHPAAAFLCKSNQCFICRK